MASFEKSPYFILFPQGLLGTPKIAGGLSVARLLDVGWRLGCQPSLLDQLLPLVDSSQQRYQLAVQYKRHRVAIDVPELTNLNGTRTKKLVEQILTSNKDRIGLLQYKDSLGGASEVDYINNILRVSVSTSNSAHLVRSLYFNFVDNAMEKLNLNSNHQKVAENIFLAESKRISHVFYFNSLFLSLYQRSLISFPGNAKLAAVKLCK